MFPPQAPEILNSNYPKTAKNRAMNEHEALLPKNKTRVVERGALKTILIAFCGAAVLAGVAVPRGSRGGGLRGAPTALKAAALSATESGLVRDVDPSRWAIECVQPYQEVNAVVQPFLGADFSNYDLINMPSGICVDGLSCSFENCNASINSTRRLPGTRSSEARSTTTSLMTSSGPSSPTTPSFVL